MGTDARFCRRTDMLCSAALKATDITDAFAGENAAEPAQQRRFLLRDRFFSTLLPNVVMLAAFATKGTPGKS